VDKRLSPPLQIAVYYRTREPACNNLTVLRHITPITVQQTRKNFKKSSGRFHEPIDSRMDIKVDLPLESRGSGAQ
jgi:hypothetical protein